MKVGIVLAYYNFVNKFVLPCLESLVEHTTDDYVIYVVDNETSHKDNQKVVEYCFTNPNIHYKRIDDQKQNGGLTGAWNQGIDFLIEKNCDRLILLNHDTIVNNTWKEYYQEINNDNTVYGPLTNNPGGAFKKNGQIVQFNESKAVETDNTNVGYINGFCFGFTSNTAKNNMIGDYYFDPKFPFGGNESEWQLRLFGIKPSGNSFANANHLDKIEEHNKAVIVNKSFVFHYKDNGWGPHGSKYEDWKFN